MELALKSADDERKGTLISLAENLSEAIVSE